MKHKTATVGFSSVAKQKKITFPNSFKIVILVVVSHETKAIKFNQRLIFLKKRKDGLDGLIAKN